LHSTSLRETPWRIQALGQTRAMGHKNTASQHGFLPIECDRCKRLTFSRTSLRARCFTIFRPPNRRLRCKYLFKLEVACHRPACWSKKARHLAGPGLARLSRSRVMPLSAALYAKVVGVVACPCYHFRIETGLALGFLFSASCDAFKVGRQAVEAAWARYFKFFSLTCRVVEFR